jgi:hypothetical protein
MIANVMNMGVRLPLTGPMLGALWASGAVPDI